MKTFAELTLPDSIREALRELSFETPTPIQAQGIPAALLRRDVLGCSPKSKAGAGKTAAYCIPALARVLKSPGKTALVLVPDAELAVKVAAFWQKLAKYCPEILCACLIGGEERDAEEEAVLDRDPRLLVATPERLMEHLSRGAVTISKTELLVLDEADRMMDLGFMPQLDRILRYLPKTRQTLLFVSAATLTSQKLTRTFLKDPIAVTIADVAPPAPASAPTAPAKTATAKKDKSKTQKDELLLDEIKHRKGSVLICASTDDHTDRVADYLGQSGLNVSRLHGGRTQIQRKTALVGFRNGKFRILVATDVAARAIDTSSVAHVIDYEMLDRGGRMPVARPTAKRTSRTAAKPAPAKQDGRA